MAKEEKSTEQKQEAYIQTEEQENGFVEIRCRMDARQAAVLKKILFESDFDDPKQVEDDIFQFGRMLHARDVIGRKLFVYMFSLLHCKKY